MLRLGLILGVLLPCTCAAGAISINFNVTFGDDMVLQQEPAVAAVYGTLSAPTEDVSIQLSDGAKKQVVKATVTGTNWKALLPKSSGDGYTITASCTSCNGSAVLQRVAFGDVWYCGGQSNMALPLSHTMGRNESEARIKAGHYDKIRIQGMSGNMNPTQPWSTLKAAAQANTFMSFSATCYYFGERLADNLNNDRYIGLIHTAWGGSRIEQWMQNTTTATCGNATIDSSNQEWWDTRVMPYADMTLKGWVWYQGENNMHAAFGNSQLGYGYSCLMVKLVDEWRKLWSSTPGTTDPMAPFGLVTLAPSGTEGGNDIGTMRWAQTGGYGVLPNPAMPNTFLAQAYDLNDPYANTTCYYAGCCPYNYHPKGSCDGCDGYCKSTEETNFYMGPIHPRDKRPVGDRLADSAASLVYKLHDVWTGPTLSGCAMAGDKKTLTLKFNTSLLGNGAVVWNKYQPSASKLHVLVNASLWCMQTSGRGSRADCIDNGADKNTGPGDFDDDTTWVPVDFMAQDTASNTVTVDLSNAKGDVFGVRYAWQGDCCSENAPTSDPCPIASCPLMSKPDNLPANPFMAKIVNGKCECLAPQVCDE